VAVGQYPEPFPFVGGSRGTCRQSRPDRIEPAFGKVPEYVSPASPLSKEPWDVLQEHEVGSHFANHPIDVGPEPPGVVGAETPAGSAVRLARESRSDEIHDSTPWSAVEGREIVPNRCRIHDLFFHAGHDSRRGEGIPFTSGHKTGSTSGGK
jgi:hypothetical protein